MKYRLEHEFEGKQDVKVLDGVALSAARSRAARLSAKDDGFFGLGHSVYLIGSDEQGDDQEQYVYFAGTMVE